MAVLNADKVIRRVRHRMGLSQEGLSRLLNATKGAVQHWERGRNRPDLGRLLALRQLCPPGPERKELDALIRRSKAEFAPIPGSREGLLSGGAGAAKKGRHGGSLPGENILMLRRENDRLTRQVTKAQEALERRNEQLRILEDVVSELQKDMAKLRTK
jgi:transcriptional regulator with XRE-family HTH domain